jgi:hypothetical protein
MSAGVSGTLGGLAVRRTKFSCVQLPPGAPRRGRKPGGQTSGFPGLCFPSRNLPSCRFAGRLVSHRACELAACELEARELMSHAARATLAPIAWPLSIPCSLVSARDTLEDDPARLVSLEIPPIITQTGQSEPRFSAVPFGRCRRFGPPDCFITTGGGWRFLSAGHGNAARPLPTAKHGAGFFQNIFRVRRIEVCGVEIDRDTLKIDCRPGLDDAALAMPSRGAEGFPQMALPARGDSPKINPSHIRGCSHGRSLRRHGRRPRYAASF